MLLSFFQVKSYIVQFVVQFVNEIKYKKASKFIQSPIKQSSNHANILVNKLADNSHLLVNQNEF